MKGTVEKNGQILKYGYTTGSCARVAVRAALKKLFFGVVSASERLSFGEEAAFDIDILDLYQRGNEAGCFVRKDSGDDPDITNHTLIGVTVCVTPEPELTVEITGGQGIGRVTKQGLDQPVGEYAINSGPRRMITQEAVELAKVAGFTGRIMITVIAPSGEALAKKTFNPKLGIVGGISILGTTGLLEPMSDRAVIETVRTNLNQVRALGHREVVLTPGNIGEEFAKTMGISTEAIVQCSNYIGDALLMAHRMDFERITLIGHAGKLVKLAGKMMNTHSMYGDCRGLIVTAYASISGCSRQGLRQIMESVSTDDMVRILNREEPGVRENTFEKIGDEIMENLRYYLEKNTPLGEEHKSKLHLVVFTTDQTVLIRR